MADPAGNIQIVLSVDKATYTQAMAEAQRQLDVFAGKSRAAGHATVSSVQAASASLRLLEGGMTNNIRAVERFITTIPGVGAALKAAFPLVGIVALGGMLAKVGEEAVKFIETMRQMPQQLTNAWRSLTLEGQTANDNLQKSIDDTLAKIAILQGHRPNTLAIELDDARIAADNLVKSVASANSQVDALMKQNAISAIGAFFTGQGGTTDEANRAKQWMQKIYDSAYQYNQAVRINGDKSPQANAAHDAYLQQIRNAQYNWNVGPDGRIQSIQQDIAARRSGLYTAGNQSANITSLEGVSTVLNNMLTNDSLQQQKSKSDAKEKQLQDAKDYADKLKQQQTQIVAQWRQQLDQQKALQDMSVNQEAEFWIAKASSAKTGSLSYTTALDEASKLVAQQQKDYGKSQEEYARLGLTIGQSYIDSHGQTISGTMGFNDLSRNSDALGYMRGQGSAAAEYVKNLNDSFTIQRQNADALSEQSIQMGVATGAISKLDAAQATAALHAQQYAESLKDLQDAIQSVANNPALSTLEKQAQTSALTNQIAGLNGQRQIQAMQDQQGVYANTISGSSSLAMSRWIQQSTDMAAQISQLQTQMLDSVNSSLSQSLMAPARTGRQYRQNILNGLSGTARGLGSQTLDMGMKSIEGGLLGGLFKGKPDGTRGNPMYVIPMSGLGSATSAASGIGNAVSGGSKGIFSLIGGAFGGFFASGGTPLPNSSIIVGEQGPELWHVPSGTSGSIVPNNQLGSMGGHTINVDARGSSDPAGTEAAVHRAIAAAAPQLIGMSVQANHQYSRRRPSTAR